MTFIDSHTHLDFDVFDNDRNDVLKRAKALGISDIIISSTHAAGWRNIQAIAAQHSNCYAAYGLHPMFMQEHQKSHLGALNNQLKQSKAVAIGEIGLDFFISVSVADKESQIALFVEQLEIATAFQLPVVIHARKSLDIVLKYLRQYPRVSGSIHSFSGSEQQAEQLIDLGFYLGFGGPITYTRATKLRKIVSEMPLNRLLIETDSPDQPDALHHGERNEPAYLIEVAKVIATLRDISFSELATTSSNNARNLFNLKSP